MSREAMNLALAFVKDIQRGKYKGDAEEVIAALQSAMTEQPAPVQGWKLVPVEPTREIEDAIAKARTLKASEIWGDAIAAAPQPAPVQQEPVAGLLGNDQCDKLVERVMSKLASKHNPVMSGEDLNPNIMTHHALRHSIVQAAFMAGAVSVAPQPAQQQEPVAWVLLRQDEDGFEPIQFYGGKQKPEGDFKDRFTLRPVCFADATPPAQRPWVGLTKEERDELWYRLGYMDLMIAIEAKLKEKNT